MKTRIVNNNLIISIIGCALAVLASIMVFTVYMQETMYDQVQSQARLLKHILETTPEDNFEILYTVEGLSNGRVTYIYHDGVVTYDSVFDINTMESHADRPEIIKALETGMAIEQRVSRSTGKMTYYCAVKVGDGSVVRIAADTSDILVETLLSTSPLTIAIVVVIIMLCFKLSGVTTKRIVANIESYDVETGEGNLYEELEPFVNKIKRQNDIISAQLQNLTDEKRKIENIFRNIQEGIIVCDSSYNIIQTNPEACELFGIEDDGKNFLSAIPVPEIHRTVEGALTGETMQCIFERNEHWYQCVAGPNPHEGDTGAVVVVLDITDQVESERNRRRFTDNVTHELKTPLTSILGYSQLITNGLAKDTDVKKFVSVIENNAAALLSMIDDIIRISNLETGDGFTVTAVQLDEIIRLSLRQEQPLAESHSITIDCQLEDVKIMADESQMYQLAHNLISNAVKYNKTGGTVTIGLEKHRSEVIFTVSDSGIGIPAEDMDKIFERFYVVDKSRNKKISSSGLGLAIVKHIVKAHGGNISVKSTLGKGTTFTIRLPVGKNR
ncbi:MAG: PAS domain S-box protein [Oscillospiraceae bacterium]|nr:PAS domain S-box protein [Oscillospiraceae bacterium]